MKKFKHKLMDSGQATAAGGVLRSKRSQLLMGGISLPLCVFLIGQLVVITSSAQVTNTNHRERFPSQRHAPTSNHEINGHKRALCQLHESRSCRLHLEAPTLARHRRQEERRHFGLARRQALESVVNRLHILESLDEQLRAFSEAAELAQRHQQEQQQQQQQAAASRASGQSEFDRLDPSRAAVPSTSANIFCQLSLFRAPPNGAASLNSCLADKRLLNQIPPYMLNLYRQLLFELHQQQEEQARNATNGVGQLAPASQTVQSMMPYQAQIMRSFRQPKIWLPAHLAGDRPKKPDEEDYEQSSEGLPSKASQFGGATGPNVVVELSALEAQPAEPLDRDQNNNDWSLPFAGANRGAPFKWSHSAGSEAQQQQVPAAAELACDFRQRLLDASRRDEICFWFDLSENFRMRANKSLEFAIKSPPGDRNQVEAAAPAAAAYERLLEAELHVFKLFPQLAPAATQSAETSNRSTSTKSFHLKTNLLEVSLYQILPRRRTSTSAAGGGGRQRQQQPALSGQEQREQDEFPLRLLDIRRIDLNSNGWETFYVKRAVEDWLRDARLNLGLVIKAKSMFDEPIKVGLIRFADAYDHCCQRPEARSGARLIDSLGAGEASNRGRQAKQQHEYNLSDFDASHQPLLVIYTTSGPTLAAR